MRIYILPHEVLRKLKFECMLKALSLPLAILGRGSFKAISWVSTMLLSGRLGFTNCNKETPSFFLKQLTLNSVQETFSVIWAT